MTFNKVQKGITLALSFSMLAACGGSSNSSSTPDSGTNNQWVAGEFKAKEDFANKV